MVKSLKDRWDSFSDQPYPIRDRKLKKRIRKLYFWQRFKTLFLSIPLFLFSSIRLLFPLPKREIYPSNFFGIGVNLDKGEKQKKLLKELQIENIVFRFPLWDIEKIDRYIDFLSDISHLSILVIVIQDRRHIEDRELLRRDIEIVFSNFSKIGVREFQVGHTINRSKWGFFSVDEYLNFFEVVYQVRNSQFPNIQLIGSGVIDFEYYNTIHTLFHFRKAFYDATSSLLYVDRRGAPENRQMLIFNLYRKIELLFSIVSLSPKSRDRIYITETNYPIKGTEPYTPTSQYEAVTLEEYTIYMVRYFLIAIATQSVEKVYWHQLISTGYGLVNHQGEKYPQFQALKFLVSILKGERYISHRFDSNLHIVQFSRVVVYWAVSDEVNWDFGEEVEYFSIYGEKKRGQKVQITRFPIYVRNI